MFGVFVSPTVGLLGGILGSLRVPTMTFGTPERIWGPHWGIWGLYGDIELFPWPCGDIWGPYGFPWGVMGHSDGTVGCGDPQGRQLGAPWPQNDPYGVCGALWGLGEGIQGLREDLRYYGVCGSYGVHGVL